jgi:hypothetical protein
METYRHEAARLTAFAQRLDEGSKGRLMGVTALEEYERTILAEQLASHRTPAHPAAEKILDEWDHLDVEERVAALLMLAASLLGPPTRTRANNQPLQGPSVGHVGQP